MTRGRGRFTQALTKFLRHLGPSIDMITYRDVIKRLPDSFGCVPLLMSCKICLHLLTHIWRGQTPQCRGKYDTRILFDRRIPKRSFMLHQVLQAPDGAFTINAGEAWGITKGTRFNIYATANVNTELLCSVVANEVLPYSTKAEKDTVDETGDGAGSIPLAGWALQTDVGGDANVCVAVLVRDMLPRVSERVKEAGRHGRPMIQLVEEAGIHVELMVVEEEGMAVFDITWQASSNDIAHPRLPYTAPIDDIDQICLILENAAEFLWHLRRSSKTSGEKAPPITIKAWKLTNSDTCENTGMSTLVSTGDNLIVDAPIQITIGEGIDTRLGITITNTCSVPLYVWLFSFNMSNLSIGVSFMLKSGPPLKSKSSLARQHLQASLCQGPVRSCMPPSEGSTSGRLHLELCTASLAARHG